MYKNQTLEKYLEKNLKERNGSEGLDPNYLKARMKRNGYDLTRLAGEYQGLDKIVYKEITTMMIERNVQQHQEEGQLTIEEVYPLVRESVSFHAKILNENDVEEEDIVQNVMIKVYNNWDNFRGESRITTWIFRIVKNEVINMIIFQNRHKRKAKGVVSIEQDGFETMDWAGSLEDMLIHEELSKQVLDYAANLEDRLEANVLELFLMGIDNKAIALTYNIPKKTVREILEVHSEAIKNIIGE